MNVFGEFALTLLVGIFAVGSIVTLRSRLGNTVRGFTLSQRTADSVFAGMALAYGLIFGTLSTLRHESFHSGGYDLGIFDQVVWNSLRGRLFENSIMIDSRSFLGHHFSPILLALVPLYAVWSDARALLILQTIALAVSALPLYWLARKQIGNGLALVLVAAYFLSPALQSVNLFEFHEIALATPMLAFAIYFLLQRRYPPLLVCLFLAWLTKEEVAFIIIAFGAYILIVHRQRTLGLALMLFGTVWGVAVIQYVIPLFYGTMYGHKYYFVERYVYLGETVSEIVTNAITQPGLVLQHLLVPVKIEFVLHLIVSLGFAPLLGAEVLALALPSFAYILIGDNAFQNSIRFQYTAPLLPFVFFAADVGVRRLLQCLRWNDNRVARTSIAALIGAVSITDYFFQSPGPLAGHFDLTQYAITAHTQLGYTLMQQIPSDVSLMAESNLVPHLSQRQTVYQASVVPNLHDIDYLLIDKTLPIHTEYAMIWQDILPSPFFETLVEQDGYILKKRATITVAHPTPIQFGDGITLLGYTMESPQPARRGETISLMLAWRADQSVRERYIVFMHVLDDQGRIWTQGDREPANGWFRTDRWETGDLTNDRYLLELPDAMPPGKYSIIVGLYNLATGARLITREGHDYSGLTTIEVK